MMCENVLDFGVYRRYHIQIDSIRLAIVWCMVSQPKGSFGWEQRACACFCVCLLELLFNVQLGSENALFFCLFIQFYVGLSL